MPGIRVDVLTACCLAALALAPMSGLAASDEAALDLKAAGDDEPKKAKERSLRLFGELAAGRLSQRFGLPGEDMRRASIDLTWDFKPAPQWRGVISNRFDDAHPVEAGSRSTLNSLREAYVGWQGADGRRGIDLGRINLRYGPAYGFNPTDYFRDGATRAVTSADPLALRENRLGTAMLRLQQLWDGGAVTAAIAPKLRDSASPETLSLDLGSTNHADRVLVAVSGQVSEKASLQGFAFHERGKGSQLGANATALFGDATVGFFEWSAGRDAELFSQALDPVAKVVSKHRAVLGMTYTSAARLALTVEMQYNGFALSKAQWNQAVTGQGTDQLGAYLYQVQARQDIASRRAMMVYLSKRDAVIKNLELTGLVRYNADDRSRFAWAEARYHWPRFDLALQWQANMGRASSEYGSSTGRQSLQLLAAFYY